ncbi:MAG TPA: ion channel [Actinomycetota bacterium]
MSESHAKGLSHRPLKRLLVAFVSLDSFGSVMVLILVTYALSVSVDAAWGQSLVLVLQIATVWLALRIAQARRGVVLGASIALAFAGVIAALNVVGVGETDLAAPVFLVSALLYFIAPISILRALISKSQVDQETVLGAIDAYLMVGMFFAYTYMALGAIHSPFFENGGQTTVAQALFFSFTTLTTTGYGNLVPAGNPGQSFAVLEMLIGQLFLVTAVAKVINAWRPARWKAEQPEDDAASEAPK